MNADDLHQHLAIDKSALDDEVIRQPSLFYMVSEQLVTANAERDASKEDLATIDAELAGRWRKTLTKTADKRVTDAMVAQCVQTSHEHEKAFTAYLTAKTRAEKLQALKDAFLQRSYMLRDLVQLYSANYYEDSSLRPSKAQEASQYAANRMRIANSRAAKGR